MINYINFVTAGFFHTERGAVFYNSAPRRRLSHPLYNIRIGNHSRLLKNGVNGDRQRGQMLKKVLASQNESETLLSFLST
jgi:hypothetical protein